MAENTKLPAPVDRAASTDVVTISDPEQALAALLRAEAVEASDPELIREAIARRILFADTIEEAFAEAPSWSSQDLVGVVLEIRNVVVLKSAKAENDAGYCAAEATRLDTGEVGIFSSGATKIGAKLLWLRMHDELPTKVRVLQAENPTAKGHKPLDIELVA